MQPFLKSNKRKDYETIISNTNLFDSDAIYRPNDPNFGIQKTMKMLVYSGIETKTVNYYVAAASKNHRRKKFKLGEIKSAIAKTPGTQNVVYEVIYVDVIDPIDGNTKANYTIDTENKTTVDRVMYSTEDDTVENLEPTGITIGTRNLGNVTYFFFPNLKVETRTGDVLVDYDPVTIDVRDGFDVQIFPDVTGSVDPYRFRPVPENTVKVDSLNI